MNIKKIFPYAVLALSLGAITATTIDARAQRSTALGALSGVSDNRASYMATFNPCNGNNAEIIEMKGYEGDSLNLPKGPTKVGYTFYGWSTEYDPSKKMGVKDKVIESYRFARSNDVFYGVYLKKSGGSHTQEEIDAYMKGLEATSQKDHLYIHYYRFGNDAQDYSNWDVWCWPYRPKEGEGARFDWTGRTQSADHLTAEGTAIIDDFGGAVADLDLSQTYDGGTTNGGKKIGGTPVSYYADDAKTTLDTRVGIQIVKSADRIKPSGTFWGNDGGNVYLTLDDANMVTTISTKDGGSAYHVFLLQESVGTPKPTPINEIKDPYEDDDGTNTTDKAEYQNADWNDKPIKATAQSWKSGIGTGYQIMVSSFADSDGDGFGDIYGIEQKLPYLANLGVKALWLTPIQLSDSYHGYDISNYLQVDPKFGSKNSPAGVAAKGEVTSATAMEDYKSLLEKAHELGMKVVMDLVINHTSTSNAWFVSSSQLDANYRGFYQWGNHEVDSKVCEDNYWYPYGDHPYSYYAKFGSSMPELNYSYQNTRKAIEDMALTWCGLGVDGFRIDAVKHVYMVDELGRVSKDQDTLIYDISDSGDYSSDMTKNLNFFREFNYTLKSHYPEAFIVGENFDGHAFHVAPYYEGFDSMFDFYAYYKMTNAAASAYNPQAKAGHWNQPSSFMTRGGTWSSSSETSGNTRIVNGDKEYGLINGKYGWNFPDLYNAYRDYRGDTPMPGSFTSNHDIARVVNRIAGTFSSQTCEIAEQGNVTPETYAELTKKANAAKIAEILMPGCTWIYYGDEIGMTGNFDEGKTSKSDYADLAYRQPMKWVQDGVKGDGSMTTGYGITGSAATVKWDAINASSTVPSVETQVEDSNSTFAKIKAAVAFKNAHPSLISGKFSNNNSADYTLSWTSSGTETLKVSVDFDRCVISVTGDATLNIAC